MADLFDLNNATDLDTQKLPIQTVNGVKPDSKGNISITSVANATNATNATNAVNATNATNAVNATKASQNASGYALANTIVKSIAISGRTITVTKIDGTSYTLTTQDTNTTYTKLSQFANDVGFITSAGSCAHAKTADSATNATNATKATQDSAGQQINTTYIKGVSVSGRTVTFTRGNGTTFAITTQDTNTTYDLSPYAKKSDLYNSLAGYFGSTAVGGIRTVKFVNYPNDVTAGTSVAGSKLYAVDGSTRLSGTWKVTDRLYNLLVSSGSSGHVDYNTVLAIRIA